MKIVLGSPLDYCNEFYFERWCKYHSQYCDKLVIYYDDFKRKPLYETLEIALKYNVDFNYIGEEFYETKVWRAIVEKCLTYNPDWIGVLAVDSIFNDKFLLKKDEMFNVDTNWYGFPIYNFWESETHYRVDGVWGAGRTICLHTFFKVRPEDATSYSFGDRKIHGSHFPDDIKLKPGIWEKTILVKHMGYVKKDAWKERCVARGLAYGDTNTIFAEPDLLLWEEQYEPRFEA